MTIHLGQHRRKAIVAPLTGVLLILLFGMVAFAIDTMWMVTTKSELQNAADSAAMAGAQELYKNYTLYYLPGQSSSNKADLIAAAVSNARTAAKSYGAANGAGDVNSLTLLDSDIQIGFRDSSGNFTAYATGGNYPNTVKVLDRRDSSANQSLRLFFGNILGRSATDLNAAATASIYTGSVSTFKSSGSRNIMILPFTYDVEHWKEFLSSGKNPDGQTSMDSSNNPQIQVYPSNKYTGNFGQLALDSSNVGASQMRDWLFNGLNSSEISHLEDSGLLPVENHDSTKWDWQGSTGLTASLVHDANSLAGQTGWLPLFKAYNSSQSTYQAGVGTGNYYYYNIVAFVPVTLMRAQNRNNQVVVQPANLADEFADFSSGSMSYAGTSTATFPVLLAPKLSD